MANRCSQTDVVFSWVTAWVLYCEYITAEGTSHRHFNSVFVYDLHAVFHAELSRVLILCMHMSVYRLHCVCCESVRGWRSWWMFLRRSRAPVSAAARRVPETHSPGTWPNTSGSNAPDPPPERCWTRPRGPSSASQVCCHICRSNHDVFILWSSWWLDEEM